MPDTPDIRIGTAEREQAMARLSDHFSAGRLSVAEFDERSAAVAAAVTRGDLAPIFADLPEPTVTAAAVEPAGPASQAPGPRLAGPVMAVVTVAAVGLASWTGYWEWYLMFAVAGPVVGVLSGRGPRERRRERRQRRRELGR
ncbi:DUF1707 SHOCT-like domain-containing protein [Nocardia stercoris]|uniref:DUF1707 domain-containing protein n=1 Tax=Nocardia stercoris TaxID=2483361 RepID=A0A3M2L1W7_9NOCA|nr:DUF1707 domain-containing protein [Nocardia stercoris]RMI31719.1 DUF1707 domain-containing protein [Nocardia stercoris]